MAFEADLSQEDVVKIIIDNNEEIKSLVALYFESTTKTLNLFNTVEKCVEKANTIQLLIRVAIKEFETESMDMKYAETLETLNKVKSTEDPFGEEFETQYESILKEQVMLLDKFREMQVMLEKNRIIVKKMRKMRKLRKFGNILVATTFVSVIALPVCATAVAFPSAMPLVAALVVARAVVGPTETVGKCVKAMLKDYEKSVETHKDLFMLMENSTEVNIKAMKTVKSLVEILIIRISSILKTVEVAVETREEEAMKLVMQEIIKKVQVFDEKIKQVGAHVAECSELVVSGRINVLNHT